MYKAGVIDIPHDLIMKNVIHLSVLALMFYPITADQVISLLLGGKINMFFLGKLRMELKCHRFDVTDVDIFYVFYRAKMTSNTEAYF